MIGASYVNAPVAVTLPTGVVTITSFAPAVFAGVLKVTDVASLALIETAADPPTVMPVMPLKLVPVIVIGVPPDIGPDVKDNETIVGLATPAFM
jgi:hypothetical protein